MDVDFYDLSHALALEQLPYRLLRGRHNAMVAEIDVPDQQKKAVIKLWKKPGLAGFIRRLSKTGNVYREWQVMNLLYKKGVPTPQPFGIYSFPDSPGGYTDAVAMSYFDESIRGIEHLRLLSERNLDDERIAFEESVINLTESTLNAGVLDVDHHLVNILALRSNNAVRVDFEIATLCQDPNRKSAAYGKMLGMLISTHLFAVQPHIQFTDRFSQALIERLNPPPKALDKAKKIIYERIEAQRVAKGIRTPWVPSW